MCMGGAKAARAAARDAEAAEAERQGRINAGRAEIDRTFGRFDDSFYSQRERAFTDYANPQLDRQFQDAREALIYALADAGTLNSSVASSRLGDLERDYSEGKLRIADEARGYVQRARSDVEGARSSVLSNLLSSADVGLAQQQAAQQAQALATPPTFSPLAQMFQNVTAGIGGARAANEATAIRERYQPLYPTNRQGSGRVVNA